MTTIPEPENPEDELQRMFDEMEFDLPEPDEVDDVTAMPMEKVIKRYNQLTEELLQIGEALHPRTQYGRDLHSERAAYQLRMKKEGL